MPTPSFPEPPKGVPNPVFGLETGTWSQLKGAGFTVLVLAAYMALYPSVAGALGPGTLALYTLPLLVAGWCLGAGGGVIAGFLFFPVNTFLLHLTGASGPWVLVEMGAGPAAVMAVVLGAAIGHLRDLREAVRDQAAELERRHRLFVEESRERKTVEERLLSHMRMHEDVLANVPAGVLQVNPDGSVAYQNRCLVDLLCLDNWKAGREGRWNLFQHRGVQAHPAFVQAVQALFRGASFDDFQLSIPLPRGAGDRVLSVSGVPVVERYRPKRGLTYRGGVLLVREVRGDEAFAPAEAAQARATQGA